MSEIVRLHVPPFAPASPISLAALRRPLIQEDATHCAAHCQPCEVCQSAQKAEIAAARQSSADLGLRLSQLLEDAVSNHASRIEAQQTALVTTILSALLPDLAQENLRQTLQSELSEALSDPMCVDTLRLRKNPDLDLGTLAETTDFKVQDDPTVPVTQIILAAGEGTTRLDAQPIIDLCRARMGLPVAPTLTDTAPKEMREDGESQ